MATVTPFPQSEILTALFDFFRYRKPALSAPVAMEIVRSLSAVPRENRKAFATAVRQEFDARGFKLKQTHALHLAARLMGFQSWPQVSRTLSAFTVSFIDGRQIAARDWADALDQVCEQCLAEQEVSRELVLRAYSHGLTISHRHHDRDRDGMPIEMLIAAINPVDALAPWWQGAHGPLESFRRRLEEGHHFFVDGYLAARLCSREYQFSALACASRLIDAGNSELVLSQQDHPDVAYEMTEIARGDELECFAQLERALDRAPGTLEIEIEDEAWVVQGRRYRWELVTLRPHDYVPGLATFIFAEPEYSKLKHRYYLARAVLNPTKPRRANPKTLTEVDGPRESYRVNRHAMLRALHDIDLDWASYSARYPEDTPEVLESEMPLGALLKFAERVPMKDANVMFARPNRSELSRIDSDDLLRALYCRVQHVVYRVPQGIDPELKDQVQEIVKEFAESVHAYHLIRAGAFQTPVEHDTAHLAWIDDARTLCERTRDAGLTLFAGRIPRLIGMEGMELPPGVPRFAFGHSLYLDFDRD